LAKKHWEGADGKLRETTLRQIVYSAVSIILKQDGLTRTELHELADFILDNSSLNLSAEKICLAEGNYFGVGEYNKDRGFALPRFITFELTRPSAFDIMNNNKSKTWRLRSHETFEELENYLTYSRQDQPAVFIDGTHTEYNLMGTETWGYEVQWIGCDAVYIATYVLNNKEEKELINSKLQLQRKLIELVEQGAEEIQAYNVVQGENMPFKVQGVLYNSNQLKDNRKGLVWVTKNEDECEDPF